MIITERPSRRCVAVAPPTAAAAIGGALRQAMPLNGEMRSLDPFADVLARLERR